METTEVEMGPIDYLLVEWPGRQPNGEVAPDLVDLVDRGLIRILDLAFIAKDEDGNVAGAGARRPRRRSRRAGGLRGRLLGPARRRRRRGGRRRAGARHLRRPAGLREHLGGAVRRRGPPLRRRAGRQRPHPRPRHPRRARRRRGQRLERGTPCQDYFEAWPAPRSSPAPPPRSATASPAARASAGPNRNSSRTSSRLPRPRPRHPRPPAASSTIDQLKELGELKAQGILTEEEFAAQKAKMLGS